MREIDTSQLVENIDAMINTLEYDSMRSAGKTKLNASTLLNLHELRMIYKNKNSNKQPTKPKKQEVADG